MQDSFRRYGDIETSLAVTDLRYVRLRDRGRNKGPAIDLITKELDLTLKFYTWAKDGRLRQEVEQFAAVLGTFMRIPDAEIPTVQPPELQAPAEGTADSD